MARVVIKMVVDNYSEVFDRMEEMEQNLVLSMEDEWMKPWCRVPFDIRLSVIDTKLSDRDFFCIEDNGKMLMEAVVFDSVWEKELYLRDFRKVRVTPMESFRLKSKSNYE